MLLYRLIGSLKMPLSRVLRGASRIRPTMSDAIMAKMIEVRPYPAKHLQVRVAVVSWIAKVIAKAAFTISLQGTTTAGWGHLF